MSGPNGELPEGVSEHPPAPLDGAPATEENEEAILRTLYGPPVDGFYIGKVVNE